MSAGVPAAARKGRRDAGEQPHSPQSGSIVQDGHGRLSVEGENQSAVCSRRISRSLADAG